MNNETALELERGWVAAREKVARAAWREYLSNLGIDGLDLDRAGANPPRIGLAVSGGGLRSTLNGAGVLMAMDARHPDSVESGTGGLLQAATYMAGLSGGAWLVNSLHDNGFPPLLEWGGNLTVALNAGLNNPGRDFDEAADSLGVFEEQIDLKEEGGFETTVVDRWGRLISHMFFPGREHGSNTTLSSLLGRPQLKDHSAPLPITSSVILFDEEGGFLTDGLHFESNPFTSGVSQWQLDGWMRTELLGTEYDGGRVEDEGACVYGFDNLGFVSGVSSAVFASVQDKVGDSEALEALVDEGSGQVPNLYKGMGDAFDIDQARLGDGGLGSWGNLPLPPLLLPGRGVDVIFAVDNSNDGTEARPDALPDGRALVMAAEHAVASGLPFPEVPTQAQFDADPEALLGNVTFFGCGQEGAPRIVYVPNRRVAFDSAQPTTKLDYTPEESAGMLVNGYALLTDGPLPRCIGCLLVEAAGEEPRSCAACMEEYCWQPPRGVRRRQ